uniref:Uncharacterized protein n=1 Tax=Anopheles epiroticus TaxID=199890 RepID=A0A182PDJ2_9DIPT
MNGNFCYPYAAGMLRSASPYPALGGGGGTGGRYGTDYRGTPLGYHPHGHPGGYDGYDKYYGSWQHHHHQGPSSYQTGYYGNYPPSYRDYGGYGGHYYHQSQSPYARGAGGGGGGLPSPMYGGSGGSTAGSYPYPGRHYPAAGSSSIHPFGGGGRESSYSYHAQREHHQQQQQYSSFASYTHLPPYGRTGVGTHDHSGGKSHHHHHPTQQYPPQQSCTGSHPDRGLAGGVEGPTSSSSTTSAASSTANCSSTTSAPTHPSPLYGAAQNGEYTSPSADYTLPTESTQHPPCPSGNEDQDATRTTPTATPTPETAQHGATGMYSRRV